MVTAFSPFFNVGNVRPRGKHRQGLCSGQTWRAFWAQLSDSQAASGAHESSPHAPKAARDAAMQVAAMERGDEADVASERDDLTDEEAADHERCPGATQRLANH